MTIFLDDTTTKAKAQTGAAPDDVCEALRQAAGSASPVELYRQVLRGIAARFSADYAAFELEKSSGIVKDEFKGSDADSGSSAKMCAAMMLDARYQKLPRARLFEREGMRLAALAVPIVRQGDARGAISVVASCDSKALIESYLREFRAVVALADVLCEAPSARAAAAPARREVEAGAVAKAAGYANLEQFAFSLVNSLRSRIGCDQVYFGVVERRKVKLLCVSGMDDTPPRSLGAQVIEQAMDESVDAGRAVGAFAKPRADDAVDGQTHPLHRQWREQAKAGCVVSFPLQSGETCAAVVGLLVNAEDGISSSQLRDAIALATPMATAVALFRRAGRSARRHVLDSVVETVRDATRRGKWVRKGLWATLAACVLWAAFGSVTYVVSTDYEVVPLTPRHVAAPFKGRIAAIHVMPGDRVAKGQLLLELDTKESQLERSRLLAGIHAQTVALSKYIGQRDNALAAQAGAEIDQMKAELELVEGRIREAEIRAPAAGTIISGDLQLRLGETVPLGDPLLQMAADDAVAIELRVAEHAAPMLVVGQSGEFTTAARPELGHACHIERIDPAAAVVDGANVIRAIAKVESQPEWLRVGMKGTAHINTERRPVWWVCLHRALDAIRIQWWKL